MASIGWAEGYYFEMVCFLFASVVFFDTLVETKDVDFLVYLLD